MSNNIHELKPCTNIPLMLRKIAAQVESGEIDSDQCTLIIGTEVYQLGEFDDGRAAESAIFAMNFGIHKLMRAGVKAMEDPES